jgi:hypothetical protein
MAYQMTITLTDAEYTALSVEAAKKGKALESLLHEMVVQHIKPPTQMGRSLSSLEIQEFLFHEGVIERMPTGEQGTEEEDAEREYLAHLFGQGKLASEMVIEDRGPY